MQIHRSILSKQQLLPKDDLKSKTNSSVLGMCVLGIMLLFLTPLSEKTTALPQVTAFHINKNNGEYT